jgi:hypothetical protein
MFLFKFFSGIGVVNVMLYFMYERQYQNFLLNLSYFLIYIYSSGSIRLRKICDNVKEHPQIKDAISYLKNQYYLHVYKNNLDIVKFSNNIFSLCIIISKEIKYLFENTEIDYDFIVYSDVLKIEDISKNPINKIIYYRPLKISNSTPFESSKNDPTCINETQSFENAILTYEKCDFIFPCVSIYIHKYNKSYDLSLFSENENFFIVKNKLNKLVFCYLLLKQHKKLFDEFSIKYTLTIVNQNMDIVKLNEKDELIFNKNSYEIKPFINVEINEKKKHFIYYDMPLYDFEFEYISDEEENKNYDGKYYIKDDIKDDVKYDIKDDGKDDGKDDDDYENIMMSKMIMS